MAEAGYDDVGKRVQSIQTASKSLADGKALSEKAGDTFEKNFNGVQQSLNGIKNQGIKSASGSKSQLENLVNLDKITSGRSSAKYLKKKFTKAVLLSKPKIESILLEESINLLGCSQEQTYNNNTIYIRVKSVDILGTLKKDPLSEVGKILYEQKPIQYNSIPFSMNRELRERIQNEGVTFNSVAGSDYRGFSGQDLFDIRYVEVNPITGDDSGWFEVKLSTRVNSVYKITTFLKDYYKTLQLIDISNFFAQLMELIAGVMSMKDSVGLAQVEDASRFNLLLARILGVCFDSRKEIDVQGTSKIGELDLLDDSFFELTEFDLRNINQRASDIFNKVLEFEDCNNVKVPVDFNTTIASLNNLNFVEGEELVNNVENLTGDVLVTDDTLRGLGINFDFEGKLDFDFLFKMPIAFYLSLSTPKILLPLMIMLKQLGNIEIDALESLLDFFKTFKKYILNVVSRITAIFIEELFNIIKRDVVNLIQAVVNDLEREKADKRIIMVLKLIQVIIILAKLISDYRRCKSIIDELLQLLQVALPSTESIPLPLLAGSAMLPGTSPTRAFINTVQEMQKKGLPTGDLPDGSPNLFLQSMFSSIKGSMTESFENGKTQILVPSLAVTPAGTTVPISAFGKSF